MIVHVLGVPMDLGSGRRGVDMGPSAIRIAGVEARLRKLGHEVVDEGDITIKNMEELKVGDVHARYLKEIARASALACKKVDRILTRGHFPLILGGDHSIALGTVSGIAAVARRKGKKLGTSLPGVRKNTSCTFPLPVIGWPANLARSGL